MREAPQDAKPEDWHRHFAALANDRAWTLAEQRNDGRDDAELLAAAHASAWHWDAVGTPLQRLRARMLLAHVHALVGHGATALVLAGDMRREFLAGPDTPDWELALVHAIHAHAAHAAGDAQAHAESYRRADAALAAIADDDDRELVTRTFRQVPVP